MDSKTIQKLRSIIREEIERYFIAETVKSTMKEAIKEGLFSAFEEPVQQRPAKKSNKPQPVDRQSLRSSLRENLFPDGDDEPEFVTSLKGFGGSAVSDEYDEYQGGRPSGPVESVLDHLDEIRGAAKDGNGEIAQNFKKLNEALTRDYSSMFKK